MDTSKPVNFNVISSKVLATDPCYTRGTWCTYLIANVRNGKYNAAADTDDNHRPRRLWALHSDLPWEPDATKLPWKIVEGADIGVDSGQVSFFDEPRYSNDGATYDRVCKITLSQYPEYVKHDGDNGKPWPINFDDAGVVSGTNYGDGGYPLFIIEQDNQVVGFMIDTNPSPEEDED